MAVGTLLAIASIVSAVASTGSQIGMTAVGRKRARESALSQAQDQEARYAKEAAVQKEQFNYERDQADRAYGLQQRKDAFDQQRDEASLLEAKRDVRGAKMDLQGEMFGLRSDLNQMSKPSTGADRYGL